MNPHQNKLRDTSDSEDNEYPTSLDEQIHEHLKSVKSPSDRKKIAGLVRQLTKLPLDHTRAALETSATLAAVSLRASIEFLRAARWAMKRDRCKAGEIG